MIADPITVGVPGERVEALLINDVVGDKNGDRRHRSPAEENGYSRSPSPIRRGDRSPVEDDEDNHGHSFCYTGEQGKSRSPFPQDRRSDYSRSPIDDVEGEKNGDKRHRSPIEENGHSRQFGFLWGQ
ncbi:unnamed protein product [Prunus brigantina]